MLALSVRTIAPDVTVLEADGRITLGRNAQEFEWKIDELLKQQSLRMVLDLSKVNYLDSTGIGIIVMTSGKIRAAGGLLCIAGAAATVKHTLDLCKVGDTIPLCADLNEATASLARAARAS